MKIIEVFKPQRVNRNPDNSITLLSSEIEDQGFKIKKVELRQYLESKDSKKGQFSLITSYVETDKDSIEMTYEEGYLGEKSLDQIAKFLTTNLGISGLILRSIISLKEEIKKSHS